MADAFVMLREGIRDRVGCNEGFEEDFEYFVNAHGCEWAAQRVPVIVSGRLCILLCEIIPAELAWWQFDLQGACFMILLIESDGE